MTDNEDTAGVPEIKCRELVVSGFACFLALVGLLFLVALLLPKVGSHRSVHREQCYANLHQIALAMLSYETKYRCFPPAYVADRNGRPLHSWRVLLLPFMGKGDLYEKMRLDEPWDSPHNRSVLEGSDASQLFHCPSATNSASETSYVMVIGPNAISDGPHSVRFEDVKDGLSNTILVAEIKNSGIQWAEPRDLDFAHMSFRINAPGAKGISSYHRGGAMVVFVDGHETFLTDDLDPNLVKALITINGGEDVSARNGALSRMVFPVPRPLTPDL